MNNTADTQINSSLRRYADGSHLSLLFKKEILENKKTLLTELIVAWGSCILLGSFLGLFGLGGGAGELIVFYTLLNYIACIYASLTFSSMKHKRGRIATLMLPATSEEKFWMKWFLAVPVLIVVLIAGFYLGDLFRLIVAWLSGSRSNANYFHIINIKASFLTLSYRYAFIFVAVASFFFGQAIYLFGSILWPKLSFIKTFAATYVIEMIIGMAFLFIFKFWLYNFNLSETFILNTLWATGATQIVLTFLLYWLTYYKFKTSSVIYHLF